MPSFLGKGSFLGYILVGIEVVVEMECVSGTAEEMGSMFPL